MDTLGRLNTSDHALEASLTDLEYIAGPSFRVRGQGSAEILLVVFVCLRFCFTNENMQVDVLVRRKMRLHPTCQVQAI